MFAIVEQCHYTVTLYTLLLDGDKQLFGNYERRLDCIKIENRSVFSFVFNVAPLAPNICALGVAMARAVHLNSSFAVV